ncbi:spore germination protein [Paenibacillus donghaensis]|uniref:spore germination protein n=1 Tax=Paenibacillus donghaensis TaxID=414771 RepID=UPI0018831859|nr:spore germination protein [Paenibacillus donghaensis]MBE9914261.1 spore germination protein [Paenibacillus donghaensis]
MQNNKETALSTRLSENMERLQEKYEDCFDVVFHDFNYVRTPSVVVYTVGMTDTEAMNQHVLEPALREMADEGGGLESLCARLSISSFYQVETIEQAIAEIGDGNPVLLMDGEDKAVSLCLSKWEKRSITEPEAESVVRGPREGFIETLLVNASMVRRKLRSPSLKMKSMQIGRYSQTEVVIAYIQGVVNPSLISEITERLGRIDVDGILESGNIEELIEDNPYSPFPQMQTTERPDVVAANLLQGKAAILIEGTPIALIAPTTIFSFLHSPEDYYQRYFIGSAIRWLRYFFAFLALIGPSFYVAIVTFHQEMIPTTLLLNMAKSREQIPFPALVEALLMEIMFEALREAGVRLPKQIGSAVSIVGALVIGQAAISAGLVSSPMVMVVAITGIASFLIPHFDFGIAIRLLRFPMMLLAGFLGFFGLMIGITLILTHLFALRSFGVPYVTVTSFTHVNQLKDVLVRAPFWKMNIRPRTGSWNRQRQSAGQRPGPDRRGRNS